MEFELVLPIEEHAGLIYQWRNDPETLKMSFHSKQISWDAFYRQFIRNEFCFPDLPSLFVVKGGKRVAILRFHPVIHPLNPNLSCCKVGINVAPNERGKGIGKQALEKLKLFIKGVDAIYAEILIDNKSSKKIFESVGYRLIDQTSVWVEDIEKSFLVYRYIYPLNEKANSVFIIAEAGSNWKSDNKNLAFELIDAAKDADANAIKFQVFHPETVYVKNAGKSNYLRHSGIEEDIFEVFRKLTLPFEMLKDIVSYCSKVGIEFMASTFSKSDFLLIDPFVKRHKIASYEIGHIHLLELAALSKKPLLLSTGAATEFEIEWAVNTFSRFGGIDLTLLQCTAAYPAKSNAMNLNTIPWLKKRFNVKSGLSDHSFNPLIAPIVAVALGATTIEKHFTLDRSLTGPDHSFSINPLELKEFVRGIREAEQMLGARVKQVDETERELRVFACRGIQAVREIAIGERFKEGQNIALLRPGRQRIGLHARYLSEIEGKVATRKIFIGDGIQKGDYA